MSAGPEHFREARRLSDVIKNGSAEELDDFHYVMPTLLAAQVHATLALAAATADAADLARYNGDGVPLTSWARALRSEETES